jgi:hypothetical protein
MKTVTMPLEEYEADIGKAKGNMNDSRDDSSRWIQGYACAVASLVRMAGGHNTHEREALECAGLTSIEELRNHKIDPFDIEALRPVIEEIQARKRRRIVR